MAKEKNINWLYWFIGFICGFIICLCTTSKASAAFYSEDRVYLTEDEAYKIENIAGFVSGINGNMGLDGEDYIVFYNANTNKMYAWFLSNLGTIRFADFNVSKTLYASDYYGLCVELDMNNNFSTNSYPYDIGKVFTDPYNADRTKILILYSSFDITTAYVEGKNGSSGQPFVSAGFTMYAVFEQPEEPEEPEVPENFYEAVLQYLQDILDTLKKVPEQIVAGLYEMFSHLFAPSSEDVQADIDDLKKSIFDSVGFDIEELEATLSNVESEPIQDIYIDLKIGDSTQRVKVFDTKFLIVGVNYFRPYIRGFIMLLMFFFVLNQISYILHIGGFSKGGGEK